jgi:beta-lactamase superfamily II metal-dependent hydrolase
MSVEDVVVPMEQSRVLKVDFVDVQQGDGAVIETPGGKVVLLDGGDNQLFARYLASRYRFTSDASPKEIEVIVVSHGDADHFAGLTRIQASETENVTAHKRLFIHPKRVFHNGLVKRPDSVPEDEMLGPTVPVGDRTIITGLETDLRNVPDDQMNSKFRAWKAALRAWSDRGPIEFRRLSRGDHDAFDCLADEDIRVEVLGPILTRADGVEGLLFLGDPAEHLPRGLEALDVGSEAFRGLSAAHTINGHSVVLRWTFGRIRFLFAGDLNDQAERILTQAHRERRQSLRADVFKVPHHGSHEFSPAFFKAVAPVVSVVSSGDESAQKEYIHPRATLMGALGRYSRPGLAEPLVFVTEMVAFFRKVGWTTPEFHRLDDAGVALVDGGQAALVPKRQRPYFGFDRAAFGIVMVRTDGQRLLVFTNSGKTNFKEAYAFRAEAGGEVTPVPVRRA